MSHLLKVLLHRTLSSNFTICLNTVAITLFFAIGILTVGCSRPIISTPSKEVAGRTIAILQSSTVEPTAIRYTPTLKASLAKQDTPRPTSTPTPEEQTCPTPQVVEDFSEYTQGELFFERRSMDYYVYSSRTEEVQPIFDTLTGLISSEAGASPDHKWLPFVNTLYREDGDYLGKNLILVNSKKETITVPWDESWSNAIMGWLDNERLIISPASAVQGTIILYNPFTQEEKEIPPSFPDIINPDMWGVQWGWNYAYVVYDHVLTRAVYLSDNPMKMVLWDVENQRELWRFIDDSMYVQNPTWFKDGSEFIFAAPSEEIEDYFRFLSVSRDGQPRLLSQEEFYSARGAQNYYALSPNDRYLPFLREEANSDSRQLLLLDLETQEILDYCIDFPSMLSYSWSPDGNQVIVFQHEKTLLVDLPTSTVYQFEKIGDYPAGWLVSPP